MREKIFQSFMMGGFECSTHRTWQGRRLDVVAATSHDRFAFEDYERLLQFGMRTARDGIRWHLIETKPYEYDFSSALNQVRAARETGIQIIWDLFHYGYPDDLDLFSPAFPARFAGFAEAFIEFLLHEDARTPFICPINELSFFAWAAGDVRYIYPCRQRRGNEVKRQLVRASIRAIDGIRRVRPAARFVQAEPAIHITAESSHPSARRAAERRRLSQFQALDMLAGRIEPELGGAEKYLDIIGLNYYHDNQWQYPHGGKIRRGDWRYRPFSEILAEWSARYNRPIFVSETGIEDDARPDWFRYVAEQTRLAQTNGTPVEGICLYPIVNHPGWDDDRHCRNGLWCYPDANGAREIYQPLAAEIENQRAAFEPLTRAAHK